MPSPLSFMVGLRPTGLSEFVSIAHPAGIYGLNNCPRFPGVLSVLRIQNDTWGRLPDACGVDRYFETEDPIASANYELLEKTRYVPTRGYLNLLDFWKLTDADWYAPYNEWALDQGSDAYLKADWMNAWTCRALEIAHSYAGLKLCIGSFATGNPELYLLPNLYPMFRLAKRYGGISDWHEYGVEGALMTSPSSGALRYRTVYQALPADARIPMMLSEFWWGNGFEASNIPAQIADAATYGRELAKDSYLLWASAFQLDLNAESNFTTEAVSAYATIAADIQKEDEPIMPTPFIFGVHSPASPGDISAADVQGIQRAAKFIGYKFLSGDTPTHYQQIFALGIPSANCITRLFVKFDDRPKPTPEQFCDEQRLAIQEAMNVQNGVITGVSWFELLNEPNLTSEWPYSTDPHDFIIWVLEVIALLRAQHPGIKLVSPGLSPQPDTPQWWTDMEEHGVFDACDAIGAHVYWPNRVTMLTQEQGLSFIPLLPISSASKPVFITEYANNIASDADHEKGLQYVDWASYIQAHYPTVTRSYLYVISSNTAAENTTRQTIVRSGIVSQIADGIRDGAIAPPVQYQFAHYHLDGGAAITTNPLQIVMNQDHSLVADAVEVIKRFRLDVTIVPAGSLTVTLNPPQPADGYEEGTVVTVTATP